MTKKVNQILFTIRPTKINTFCLKTNKFNKNKFKSNILPLLKNFLSKVLIFRIMMIKKSIIKRVLMVRKILYMLSRRLILKKILTFPNKNLKNILHQLQYLGIKPIF